MASNLVLIKNVTKNWVTGNYEKILPHVDDKAEYVVARGSLEQISGLFGTFRGKTQIQKWYALNQEAHESRGITPFCAPANLGKFIAAGNQVVSYGSLPRNGPIPANDWIAIWTLRRSKITHCLLVMDTASAYLKFRKANPRLTLK